MGLGGSNPSGRARDYDATVWGLRGNGQIGELQTFRSPYKDVPTALVVRPDGVYVAGRSTRPRIDQIPSLGHWERWFGWVAHLHPPDGVARMDVSVASPTSVILSDPPRTLGA